MAAAASLDVHVPMFSQRGYTCGPDSLFTILFETDGIRDRFAPLLHQNNNKSRSGSSYQEALSLAVKRYRRMIAGPHKEPIPYERRESRNEGEGAATLEILSECGPDNIGMAAGRTEKLLHSIVVDGALGVPLADLVRVVSLPDVEAAVTIDDEKTVAILVEYDKYKAADQVYTKIVRDGNNTNTELSEEYEVKKDLRLQSERKFYLAGHIAAFLKRNGIWYYADNEVGWLHKIENQDFVNKHLIKALREGTPIAMGYMKGESANPTLLFGIAADGVVYKGESELAKDSDIDWSFEHYGLAEAHVFMLLEKEKVTGGARKTRRRRRHRSSRNRTKHRK